jgi:RHS repeat-associated protein
MYASNESSVQVFFDNLQLIHKHGPLVDETHYYPFGLTMAGISSKAAGMVSNKRKFNAGSELQSEEFSNGSGLELYSTMFRSLDPQIGRWHQIDPKPTYDQSLYSSMRNNPIQFNDPLGDTIPNINQIFDLSNPMSSVIWYGIASIRNERVRDNYVKELKGLDKNDIDRRNNIKEKTRTATPEPFKSILETARPMEGEKAKVKDPNFKPNAGKSNAAANDIVKTTGTIGKIIVVGGLIQSGITIANSPTPVKETITEGAGWYGAWIVGSQFAAATPGGPVPKFITGLIGSGVGFIGGKKAGDAVMSIQPAVSLGAKDFYDYNEKARRGEVDENGWPLPIVCFIKGTIVYSIKGEIAIENIKVGDMIFSYNIEQNKIVQNKVLKTLSRDTKSIFEITIDIEKIKVTGEHPFYVIGKGWTKARELLKGDWIKSMNNEKGLEVLSSIQNNKDITVYNIEVDGNHNYFVTQSKILVHNKTIDDHK